jgi:hypothetical protein
MKDRQTYHVADGILMGIKLLKTKNFSRTRLAKFA